MSLLKNTSVKLQKSEKTVKVTFKELKRVTNSENTETIFIKEKEKQKKVL